jgi:hypothetical protein
MRIGIRALLLLGVAALMGCAKPREQEAAETVVAEMFESSLAARVDAVIRHFIAGRVYYYAGSGCCDQLNAVYDAEGEYVCAPDGGFTGRGDGRCPADFVGIEWSRGISVANPFFQR